MTYKSKILVAVYYGMICSGTASASNHVLNDPMPENGMIKCDDITGVFLQEWINGERLLNSFIKLKDVTEPLNYTSQINDFFESNTPNSNLEIGCLLNFEGVAIRYHNEAKVSTIIQIDNDGRLQTYPETSSFGIEVKKSFKGPS